MLGLFPAAGLETKRLRGLLQRLGLFRAGLGFRVLQTIGGDQGLGLDLGPKWLEGFGSEFPKSGVAEASQASHTNSLKFTS